MLALFGEEWNRKYGSEGESLHFHNHLEVGYCYKGEGVIKLENGDYPYFPQTFTMIPKNCPHSTFGDQGGINSWEFLFIDVERFLADLYPGRSRLAEEISRRINSGARFLTHGKNPALGDLVQEIFREMKEKSEFYQESVKGYLLAFLMEAARLNDEDSLLPGEELPVVGNRSGRKRSPRWKRRSVMWRNIMQNGFGRGIWRRSAASARRIFADFS